jgi:hypothetical protein
MVATDDYAGTSYGVRAPYRHGAAVSPHDTNELSNVTLALYVGVEGALTVVTIGGETVAFAVVPAGTVIPIRVKQVKDTGTDADSIVALW